MKNLRKKITFYLFIPHCLLIVISVIYKILTDSAIAEGREFIECSFKHKFHLYCPGCGGSRSLSALLSFDFVRSFKLFPALPISVIILSDLYIRALISFIKNDEIYLKNFKPIILTLIPFIIILNFFLRNILLFYGIDLIGDFY